MRRTRFAPALLAGALLLTGCGEGEAPEALPSVTPEPSPTSTAFTAKGKGYSIVFPEAARNTKERAKTGLKLTYDVWTLRTENADFSSSRASYANHGKPNLRDALNSAARQTGGRITNSRTFTYRGSPAIEGTIVGALKSDREARVTARYILVDGKFLFGLIYRAKVKATAEMKQTRDAWLNSLRFTKA
ncbi:hypothetical protein GCM10009547_42460 [Sporichthya brevicatena]|uniref:Lipoprotein n=1 Tax=Sporichthya brevicatena TaxID=171442 RepID=A0ABN1H967_9ACTN